MEVSYVKNTRAKNLKITLKPNGTVRVTMPRFCSQRRAEAFVKDKQAWIEKNLASFADKADVLPQSERDELRKLAKEVIPKRVAEFATLHGFDYGTVTIRDTSTRWGSCSSKKNLNFSLRLMKVSQELRDYVILHELCHTVHMHHQKPFWDLMEQVCPGAKLLDKQLKNCLIV